MKRVGKKMYSSIDPMPVSDDPVAIRKQLEKILLSAQFRNSKRSQALLRFVIIHALEKHTDELREKIIGVNVFGRNAAYDTSQDAIVRNVAAEVRKRLAQYYMEDDHYNELRIDLPAGSYIPSFPPGRELIEKSVVPSIAPVGTSGSAQAQGDSIASIFIRKNRYQISAACFLVCILLMVAIYFGFIHRTSDFVRFWEPVLQNNRPVQVIVGQPTAPCIFMGPHASSLQAHFQGTSGPDSSVDQVSVTHDELQCAPGYFLYKGDSFAMARLSALLGAHGREYRLSTDSMADYAELRDSSVIAIGAANNHWTRRLISNTRFSLTTQEVGGKTICYVSDATSPGVMRWIIAPPQASSNNIIQYDDYPVITRIFDTNTHQIILLVAGNYDGGTRAAAEFITDPNAMNTALKERFSDPQKKNIQMVLHTRVLDGVPGPAQIVAIYSW